MGQFYKMCDLFWPESKRGKEKKGKKKDKDMTDKEKRDNEKEKEKLAARRLLRNAIVEQFNSIYGEDVDNVDHWTYLCDILRITPRPEGLKACRDVGFPVKGLPDALITYS
jgi:hypothetical protein